MGASFSLHSASNFTQARFVIIVLHRNIDGGRTVTRSAGGTTIRTMVFARRGTTCFRGKCAPAAPPKRRQTFIAWSEHF